MTSTICIFLALAVISPALGQPWTGSPWIPAPNVQQEWMPWNWMDRFQENVANSRLNGSNINVLFYGDSIVEGWGWNTALWERSFGHLGAANYGIGGDGTQNVLWRIINGEVENISPRIIVIMIGTNNVGSFSEEDIARGISAIVDELRTRLPTTRILLLGILPRTNSATTAFVERINVIVSARENLNTVRFLNMRDSFYVNGQFIAQLFSSGDFLHLSAAGYLRWDETMHPLFNEMWNTP
ncbi:Platelet-activating factor acetylhydrolase IB subunit alpha2 [Pseudolycoriella hygida]|uniref:Platelet-activating factor acetylhydrolase IB subunit alpha2 n=1 Tax=Pseudolycoriella hygida TaxID=35572 RepID=A0A9Q0MT32_9DIPT|nr:Platelet-activating factor acetylhydrolase IB subunit alpha2 [Pseudolycoriella hygida]